MDEVKLHIKFGGHEIEATGPLGFIRAQADRFYGLVYAELAAAADDDEPCPHMHAIQ